jgi:hypothetical protein
MVEAAFEVLAIPPILRGNLTQEKAEDGSAVCPFEHDFAKGYEIWTIRGTEDKGETISVKGRSSEPPRRTAKEWR